MKEQSRNNHVHGTKTVIPLYFLFYIAKNGHLNFFLTLVNVESTGNVTFGIKRISLIIDHIKIMFVLNYVTNHEKKCNSLENQM